MNEMKEKKSLQPTTQPNRALNGEEGSRTLTEFFSSSDEDTISLAGRDMLKTVRKLDQLHA